MSAFLDWIRNGGIDDPTLLDAFNAGRRSVLGDERYASQSIVYAKLCDEAREAKIRLAGVLCYLRDSCVISCSKMMQLADMTTEELGDLIAEIEKLREESE